MPKRIVTEEMKAKMKKLKAEGLSYKEIGKKFGVAGSTVAYNISPKERKRVKKTVRRTMKRKVKKNPDFYAKRSREWRENNPRKYKMSMAKCYMKKLEPEELDKLYKEVKDES